jgi:ABC-2 type transport system permease protein/capsular polysaccharide transport system permease protein
LPENILQVFGGWLMLAWFGMGLALLFGSLSEQSEFVDKLWHPFSYILFPLSGAAFLVQSLPVAARDLVLYLPMVHGVEYLREGYFGSQITAHYDMAYMAVCNLILTLFGLSQERKLSKVLVPE